MTTALRAEPVFAADSGGRHEEKVYRLLRRELTSAWQILHDVHIDPLDSKSPQIDFLLLHPWFGIFVLEAKASHWRSLPGGAMAVYNRGLASWKLPRRTPFQQSRGALMALRGRLDSALGLDRMRHWAGGLVPMASGVIMLDMTAEQAANFHPANRDGGRAVYRLGCDPGGIEAWLTGLLTHDGPPARHAGWMARVLDLWDGDSRTSQAPSWYSDPLLLSVLVAGIAITVMNRHPMKVNALIRPFLDLLPF